MTGATHLLAAAAPAAARRGRSLHWPARVLLAALVVLLGVAAGYQWLGEGGDYEAYVTFFESMSDVPWTSSVRFEPLFSLLAWLFSYVLGTDYALFASVLAALSLAVMVRLIARYSEWPLPLALAAYLMLFYPLHQYTQIRTAVAAAFGFLAIHLAYERRPLRAVGSLLFAVGFQYSALVLAAPVAYLFASHWKWRAAVIAGTLAGLAYVWLSMSAMLTFAGLNPLIDAYLENMQNDVAPNLLSGRNLLTVLLLAGGLLAAVPWRSRWHGVQFTLSAGGLVLFVAFLSAPVLAHRFSELLSVSTVFWAFLWRRRAATLVPGVILLGQAVWVFYLAFNGNPALFHP